MREVRQIFLVRFRVFAVCLHVAFELTLSVKTTPNFQIWYLMSMDVILQREEHVHWLQSLIKTIKSNVFTGKLCTSWTLRCRVQASSRGSWRWHPETPGPYRAALQSSLCHRCPRIYPAPTHHTLISFFCSMKRSLHQVRHKNKTHSPFFSQIYPSNCWGRFWKRDKH